MTQIPELVSFRVVTRDRYLCQRCGLKGTDRHHRRGRSVLDDHTHCACNLILLCRDCHGWVHAHPFEARATGLIVSRWACPQQQPVRTVIGSLLLDCDGGYAWINRPPPKGQP